MEKQGYEQKGEKEKKKQIIRKRREIEKSTTSQFESYFLMNKRMQNRRVYLTVLIC